MERCKVSGEEIISNPYWAYNNHAAHYSTRIKRIGRNVLYIRVDAEEPVRLEEFELNLVMKVLEDSDLKEKPFHVIWNLDKVKQIAYSYKHGIVDFLYNIQPPLSSVVFFNVAPEFVTTVESIRSIFPSTMHLYLAESYATAVKVTLNHISGKNPPTDHTENNEFEHLKNQFLRASAMIGWLKMLGQKIHLPPANHELYPFFSALSFLQEDIAAQENNHEKKKRELELFYEEKARAMDAEIRAFENNQRQLHRAFEKEKSGLTNTLALRKNESIYISASLQNRNLALQSLSLEMSRLSVPPEQKRQLLTLSETLLETHRNERQIDLPLTETDSILLSLLKRKYPHLNNRELKICLLIKQNYDNNDIADQYGISKRGMESLRYRMHKKIGLNKNQSLKNHLAALAVEAQALA